MAVHEPAKDSAQDCGEEEAEGKRTGNAVRAVTAIAIVTNAIPTIGHP